MKQCTIYFIKNRCFFSKLPFNILSQSMVVIANGRNGQIVLALVITGTKLEDDFAIVPLQLLVAGLARKQVLGSIMKPWVVL